MDAENIIITAEKSNTNCHSEFTLIFIQQAFLTHYYVIRPLRKMNISPLTAGPPDAKEKARAPRVRSTGPPGALGFTAELKPL